MTTVDLFPMLKSLPRAEKLKVMQFLIAELAKEEEPTLIAKDNPWQSLFESLDRFSEDFMTTRDQPPLDVREAF